ncbi:hypothetical protein [Saccharopolyspora griseoalba]|uniref:Uncharacterized protein n=1 Tax=Saccharopolyspora griseoalba TaxID=1431848 RepID=A0ABW2LUR9_9PSEU
MDDQQAFTVEQIRDAYNLAADEIDEVEIDNEQYQDRSNFLLAAGLYYLTGEADTLADVVELNWPDDAHLEGNTLIWQPANQVE